MSIEIWARMIVSVTFSVVLMVGIYRSNKREQGTLEVGEDHCRYEPVFSPYAYPMFIMMLFPVALLVFRRWEVFRRLVFVFFESFLYISLYYAVLLAGMPYLRRHISSRVCASLWIFPSYFYLLHRVGLELIEPKIVIRIPGNSWIICLIWAVGFVAVLGWKCLSHLHFRKTILESAETVTDATVLRIWGEEQTEAMVYRRYRGKDPVFYIPIVQSPLVKTPMTIGLWKSSMYMVMPDRNYAEEELRLIFRHELIHIGRQDSGTKFFLVFCTAMGWFNPLMWMAMRRSTEDLELSCDETVLLQADNTEKWKYARLLLETAGDDRGFSTCLSATGQSMRYRLRQVTEASPRKLGVSVAGIILVVLYMGFGQISLAYDQSAGTEVIFGETEDRAYILTRVDSKALGEVTTFDKETEDALRQYLSGLKMSRLSSEYTFSGDSESLLICYTDPMMRLILQDQSLEILAGDPVAQDMDTTIYYLHDPVDWDEVYAVLTP